MKFKSEALENAVNTALKNGYRVYVPDRSAFSISYALIGNDTGLCYVQTDYGNGMLSLHTVHKPNSQTGTGFRLSNDLTMITPQDIESAINIIAPHWATSYRKSVKKYTSIDDYVNRETILKYKRIAQN